MLQGQAVKFLLLLLLLRLLLRHEVLLSTRLHPSGEQRFSCSIVSRANVPRSLSLHVLRRHVGPRLQQQPDYGGQGFSCTKCYSFEACD